MLEELQNNLNNAKTSTWIAPQDRRKTESLQKGKKGKGRPPRQQVAEDLHENESENDPNDDFIDQVGRYIIQNATGLNNYQDQEQLSEEQKEELITKTLYTTNPQAAHNITEYSYKDRQYRKDELVDQLVVHFSFDG